MMRNAMLLMLLFMVVLTSCTEYPDIDPERGLPANGENDVVMPPESGEADRDRDTREPIHQVVFRDGVWHYRVEVLKPTPCHTIEVEPITALSYPEQITVHIRVVDSGEPCNQLETLEVVEGQIEGSERASFTITLDGRRIYYEPGQGLEPESEFDGSWVLVDARAPEPIMYGTLNIHGNGFRGSTSCNNYGGSFVFGDDGYVSVEDLVVTEMYCDTDRNADEARYIAAFASTNVMRITSDGNLGLWGFAEDSSIVILTFERARPTLEPIHQVVYRDGVWHYRVEVLKPTPCHTIEVEPITALSYPEQITVHIRVVDSGEPCNQLETLEVVEGQIEGSERASFTITLDGRRIYYEPGQGLEPESEFDGSWVLVDARAPEPIMYGTLNIHGNGFRGSTSCNNYGGSFVFGDDGYVSVEDLVVTEMYCDTDRNADEARYIAAFASTNVMRITSDGNLGLWGFAEDSSIVILTFERARPTLSPNGQYECPDVYDPVCGQPPMPPCPPGTACPDIMPQPRTYSNMCELEKAGARLIHEGACEDDLVI
ncbi:MAG: META domain-containing protein [Candidatus Woesearchaeota archaeon]